MTSSDSRGTYIHTWHLAPGYTSSLPASGARALSSMHVGGHGGVQLDIEGGRSEKEEGDEGEEEGIGP